MKCPKEGFNIVSDVAGEFDTLMALLKQMPDCEPISLGDEQDRGSKSKEVIEFFMKNGHAIFSNHAHLMIDHLRKGGFYGHNIWAYNGGNATLKSFDPHEERAIKDVVPEEVLQWIENLPVYIELETDKGKIFLSHSFWPRGLTLEEAVDVNSFNGCFYEPRNIIWCRDEPIRREHYIMQIAGHNSQWGLRRFVDEQGEYAICIDSSRHKMLTGIHVPSMKVYQQEFI